MTDALDADAIRAAVRAQDRIDSFELFGEISSTSSYLLEQTAPSHGRFRIAIAEGQTAGRGRMGKRWYSPEYSGLCLSVSATIRVTAQELPCLTLATGVGVVRGLEKLGARGVELKWPNDLIADDGKLGGILTEVHSTSGQDASIVIGVGLNHDLHGVPETADLAPQMDYVSDLFSCMPKLPSRNVVAAEVIGAVFDSTQAFESRGFGEYAATWSDYDWLAGKRIFVDVAADRLCGTYAGIDTDGALLLQTAAGMRRVVSGSVIIDDDVLTAGVGQSGSARR